MICIFKDHFNRPILSKPSNSKIQPVLRGVIEIYISIPFDFDREWTRIDDSCACDVASGEATINDNSWGQLNICSIRMPCGCLSILRSAFWYVIIIHLQQSLFSTFTPLSLFPRRKHLHTKRQNQSLAYLFYLHLNNHYSRMLEKKRISQIAPKKLAPMRLIKCYVCNKLFNTQPEFNSHLQQHQSKLNRTNVEQLQRKTQQSFRKKRLPSAIQRTVSEKPSKQEKVQQNKCEPAQKEEENFEQEQMQIEEALKQSQVLLEKIEFITQIGQQTQQDDEGKMGLQQDLEEQFPTIAEYELYLKISSVKLPNQMETVILATDFQEQFFVNYQQQIRHMRKLGKIAVNPQTQNKLTNIRKNICDDVVRDLQTKYKSPQKSEYIFQKGPQKVHSQDNIGELSYCSVCFMTVQAGSEFLKSSNGSSYHTDCYKDFQ